MSVRYGTLAAGLGLAAALAAAPVTAQQPGTIELSGFGQFTLFDDQSTLTDLPAYGLGGGLGLFLLPNLALEGSAAYVPTETRFQPKQDVDWLPIRARVAYHFPLSENVYPILGVGYTRHQYSDGVDDTDEGVHGLLGLKAYFSDRAALRLDAQADFIWAPYNAVSRVIQEHVHWTFSAGLSFDVGAGRARDTDGDGVRDRDDQCLNTPSGVAVNAVGCRLDDDRDGVYNEDDRCPDTPRGVSVDGRGCRIDSDGDGVYNEDDRCPNTPNGVTVDGAGCPVDTDRDGVPDHQDRCNNTPAGAPVDAQGCRLDSDRDGVYDDVDRCPNTSMGTEVDSRGCPVLFEEEETTLVLEGVTFETNSAELTPNARTVLDRVAESLRGNPEVRVRVEGHTDSTGSRAYNVNLSQERAESVVAYLVSQGVSAGQLDARGVGPDEPVADNSTEAGRQRNRRVELERIGN